MNLRGRTGRWGGGTRGVKRRGRSSAPGVPRERLPEPPESGTIGARKHPLYDGRNLMGDNGMAKILVVEDNPDLLMILRDLLGTEHDVETARRGEDAVERARHLGPDVVIMDLQLPSMSGIEAGRWIKKELGDHIPILALTALAQSGDSDMVLRSGCCDAYMAKPASLADIQRKVEELLQRPSAA